MRLDMSLYPQLSLALMLVGIATGMQLDIRCTALVRK